MKITTIISILGLLVGIASAAPTNNISLTWDWSDANTNGLVYRGTASGVYSTNFPVCGTNAFSDYIPLSATYYYVVMAVNMFGDQSAYSNELMVQRIKPTTPPGAKWVVVMK